MIGPRTWAGFGQAGSGAHNVWLGRFRADHAAPGGRRCQAAGPVAVRRNNRSKLERFPKRAALRELADKFGARREAAKVVPIEGKVS